MPLTILVTDDDLATRLSISDYLGLAGYSVLMAENGQVALAMVEKFQPHLLVTDISMPLMDGHELVRQVRLQPPLRLLPVIFLTERASTQERIKGYQLGCDAYLPKPFELEELGAVVRNLLERSQLIASDRQLAVGGSPPAENFHAQGEINGKQVFRYDNTLHFTDRERDVLEQLVEGLSNGQIGDRLHLSPRTVEKYVSSLLHKTDTTNRAELVRFAMEHRLVT
jgi:DNA-binding NarL/FixJ family response regulator